MCKARGGSSVSVGDDQTICRLCLYIRGKVQGVGFRPFVYRLAIELNLSGWVRNTRQGVEIEIEGCRSHLDAFLDDLAEKKPPHSYIQSQRVSFDDVIGYTGFKVRPSGQTGEPQAQVLPDLTTCPECLEELFDPDNRRYRYPFINCTYCGPRYSIIESLPYDRANTTMKLFPMCEACRAEYENALDRRFHAQPNACPECGPHLELWNPRGKTLEKYDAALRAACKAVKSGRILALKGLGGFQLIVDARNEDAVARLRKLKGRQEKPFALMYPSLDDISRDVAIGAVEKALLESPEAPIVLLPRRAAPDSESPTVARGVAADNPRLGIMLPYTPLHHLMMRELGIPVVATSGNLTEEPICIDEREALDRLGKIADLFLVHNRPIARQVDDSVVTTIYDREMVLRNARGYAPLSLELRQKAPTTLATGAHLKCAAALATGDQVILSQHIGDLETRPAIEAFQRVTDSMQNLYNASPVRVACDMHPDYLSGKYARTTDLPRTEVQHHYAHILSAMEENRLAPPALGIAWDGTGYGPDGTIWGGEFLRIDEKSYRRVAHLRTFRLPGGEVAVREPRRCALGLLYEMYGSDLPEPANEIVRRIFKPDERQALTVMLERGLNAPSTSSAGRLFDAVASLLDICQVMHFEGQAASKLEFAAARSKIDRCYQFDVSAEDPMIVDWEPFIDGILKDLAHKVPVEEIAAAFHNTLARIPVEIAARTGEERVVLSGGCFQNRYLLEESINNLKKAGLEVYWHRRVPPNDGGIALGQIIAAIREGERK